MKKRILALALVLTMCVGAATTTTASAATKSSRMTVTQFAKTEQPSAYKVKITKSDRAMLKKLFNAKNMQQCIRMYTKLMETTKRNSGSILSHLVSMRDVLLMKTLILWLTVLHTRILEWHMETI